MIRTKQASKILYAFCLPEIVSRLKCGSMFFARLKCGRTREEANDRHVKIIISIQKHQNDLLYLVPEGVRYYDRSGMMAPAALLPTTKARTSMTPDC